MKWPYARYGFHPMTCNVRFWRMSSRTDTETLSLPPWQQKLSVWFTTLWKSPVTISVKSKYGISNSIATHYHGDIDTLTAIARNFTSYYFWAMKHMCGSFQNELVRNGIKAIRFMATRATANDSVHLVLLKVVISEYSLQLTSPRANPRRQRITRDQLRLTWNLWRLCSPYRSNWSEEPSNGQALTFVPK